MKKRVLIAVLAALWTQFALVQASAQSVEAFPSTPHADCRASLAPPALGPVQVPDTQTFLVSMRSYYTESIPALQRARMAAGDTAFIEARPHPDNPLSTVANRAEMGRLLAGAGLYDTALPFLRCGTFSPWSGPFDENYLILAIAGRAYFAELGGRREAVVGQAEFSRAFDSIDRFDAFGPRLESWLPTVASTYGASSRAYYAAELLLGATQLVARQQLAFVTLENANRRYPDPDVSRFLQMWKARLAADTIIPIERMSARVPPGDLRVFTSIQTWEALNSTKSLVLLGQGDADAVRRHGDAVRVILERELRRNARALDGAATQLPRHVAMLRQSLQTVWSPGAMPTIASMMRGTPIAGADPQRFSRIIERTITGDPDQGAYLAYAMSEIGDSVARSPKDKVAVRTGRIMAQLDSGAAPREIAAEIDALQALLPALPARDRVAAERFVAGSASLLAAQEGRLAAAMQIYDRGVAGGSTRRPTTPIGERQRNDLAIAAGLAAPSRADALRLLYPAVAAGCVTFNAQVGGSQTYAALADAAPGVATRKQMCAAENIFESRAAAGDARGAWRALEHMAVISGRVDAFSGWRRAALYDVAAVVAAEAGETVEARRLADLSLRERRSHPDRDSLRSGARAIGDGVAHRARLGSIAISYTAASPADRRVLIDEALAVSEHLPRTSADRAIRDMGAQLSAGAGGAAVRRVVDAEAALDAARQRARSSAGGPQEREALAAVTTAQAVLQTARNALQSSYPVTAAALSSSTSPTSAVIARLLAPNEAVVVINVFASGPGVAIVLRSTGAELVSLPGARHETLAAVRRLREAIVDPQRMDKFPAGDAASIYQALLAPTERALAGATRVTIVPDASIDDIPFAALLTAPPRAAVLSSSGLAGAPWLLRRMAIQVQPSVSAFAALRSAPARTSAQGFIGVGNPALSGFAGATGAIDFARIAALDALPETQTELTLLGAAFGPPSKLLVGANADERAVVGALQGARVAAVAFSTHGLVAGAIKGLEEPALVLSRTAGANTAGQDGLLTASEIAALNLDVDLVLLSACDTAAGDGAPAAETLSGLARAFYAAGGRTVVASYWPVNSEATTQLMSGLSGGAIRDPAAALRASALRMIDSASSASGGNPALAHPYYWASFGVFGAGPAVGR